MTVVCCSHARRVHARACAHASKISGFFACFLVELFFHSQQYFFRTVCISFDTRRLEQTCVVIKVGEARL